MALSCSSVSRAACSVCSLSKKRLRPSAIYWGQMKNGLPTVKESCAFTADYASLIVPYMQRGARQVRVGNLLGADEEWFSPTKESCAFTADYASLIVPYK
ncbi:hypothetical protein [Marinomonas foliarum]|uniref:hypothetical protein n=1 Tax=Marinomonas foliarum TaxID=491950 RepID=UPI0015F0C3D0|nr:hypothetical protein [Marinomonas foliarum]